MAIRFIIRHLLYALPALLAIALYAWAYRDSFPAPRLTNNIAVNEQLDRLARLGTARVEVLAIGSSMTLNNLASALQGEGECCWPCLLLPMPVCVGRHLGCMLCPG